MKLVCPGNFEADPAILFLSNSQLEERLERSGRFFDLKGGEVEHG